MAAMTIFVPVKPMSKGSMRAFVNKKTSKPIITNNNPRTKGVQKTIALAAKAEWNRRGNRLLYGPVRIVIVAEIKAPKRLTREYPTVTPDADKIARLVLDALTGVVYADDKQVLYMSCEKLYSDRFGLLITVSDEEYWS